MGKLLADTVSVEKQERVQFDAIVPGVKYNEKRKTDPSHPPVVIDIEAAMLNAKEASLSHIAKSISYMMIVFPKETPAVQDFTVVNDTLYVSCSDEYHTRHSILAYGMDGRFYNRIWEIAPEGITKKQIPDIEKDMKLTLLPLGSRTTSYGGIFKVMFNSEDNRIFYSVNFENNGRHVTKHVDVSLHRYEQPDVYLEPNSNRLEYSVRYRSPGIWCALHGTAESKSRKTPFSLVTLSSAGDTLCQFANHNPFTSYEQGMFQSSDNNVSYIYHQLLTFRTNYSDTVFRLVAPDRIVPVWVLRMGKWKLEATEGYQRKTENRATISNIMETQRFLFVQFGVHSEFYLLTYDKLQKKTYLNRGKEGGYYPVFFNDLDNGANFYLSKIMSDGETIASSSSPQSFIDGSTPVIDSLFPSRPNNSKIITFIK